MALPAPLGLPAVGLYDSRQTKGYPPMSDAPTDTDETIVPPPRRNWTIEVDPAEGHAARPWTVKAIKPAIRDMAMKAARAERMTVGEWLTMVIPLAAQHTVEVFEREMARKSKSADGQAEVSPELPAVARLSGPAVCPELDAARQAAEIAKLIQEVQGMPESIQRLAHQVLRARLRAARSTV
jgi:hypothetical protein